MSPPYKHEVEEKFPLPKFVIGYDTKPIIEVLRNRDYWWKKREKELIERAEKAEATVAYTRTFVQPRLERAERSLLRYGFADNGGEDWKPPLGHHPGVTCVSYTELDRRIGELVDTYEDKLERMQVETQKQERANCTRSHPHEHMSPMCELRSKVAWLDNALARTRRQRDRMREHLTRMVNLCSSAEQSRIDLSLATLESRKIADEANEPS